MAGKIEFWFEFASTYSYLSAMRIGKLCADRQITLEWKPFLLGPLFARNGWTDSPFNIYPTKGVYMWRDMERQCDRLGLPLHRPSQFPRGSVLAARIIAAQPDAPWIGAFVTTVYTANFAEDRDIATPEVIGDILTQLGQPAPDLIAATQQDAIKNALRAQTEQAMEHGLFGAPSFRVDSELFWGDDRLEQALEWCETGG